MTEKSKVKKKVKQKSFLGMRIQMAVICIVCSIGLPLALLLIFLI
jgi:hypothetical protein